MLHWWAFHAAGGIPCVKLRVGSMQHMYVNEWPPNTLGNPLVIPAAGMSINGIAHVPGEPLGWLLGSWGGLRHTCQSCECGHAQPDQG